MDVVVGHPRTRLRQQAGYRLEYVVATKLVNKLVEANSSSRS
ncbi:hypothetical protein ACFWG6_01540 [Streptomyces erythrochromogenes]